VILLPLSAIAQDAHIQQSDAIARSQGEQAALDYLHDEHGRAVQAGDLPGQAWSKYGLGRRAALSSKNDQAISYLESAIDWSSSMQDRKLQGFALMYLALAYRSSGQADVSYAKYRLAIGALESAGGSEEVVGFVQEFTNLELHLREREYLFESGANLAQRSGLPGIQADLLKAWSDALITAGDSTGALEKLQQAMAIAAKVPDYPNEAGLLLSRGRLYRLHGNQPQAIKSYERALELRRKWGGKASEGTILQYLGISYMEVGQQRKGLARMEEAVDIARYFANRGERTGFVVRSFTGLAIGYMALGEYQRAIEILEEAQRKYGTASVFNMYWALSAAYFHVGRYVSAVDIGTQGIALAHEMGYHEPLLFLLRWRAQALHKLGRVEEAIADARQALAVMERMRTRLVPADLMKLGFTTQYLHVVNEAVDLLYETGRHTEAFEVAEQARARSFLDLLATRNSAGDEFLPYLDIAFQDGIEGLRAEPRLVSTMTTPAAKADHIRTLSRRMDSTVLAYWVNPNALYVWAVLPDGLIAASRQRISESRLNQLIRRTESRGAMDRQLWQELYRHLISPVKSRLPKSGSRLTVIPHGQLFKLPFVALMDGLGRYLIEDYALHYVPAMAVLDLVGGERMGSPTSKRYLLAADPVKPPRLSDGTALAPLTGSRREVERVVKQLSGGNADILTGAQLRSDTVRRLLGNHDVVHFATHAVIDSKNPLDSFLALSQGERISARDIYDARLSAELVVLSACRSASGPISVEGVLGLTRAFFYAGAASIVASTWDAADEPTALLVEEFYREYHRTGEKDRALRSAQLHLIQELRNGRIQASTPAGLMTLPEHPALWAGFILVGSPD
jgi:CHAT domain-containing protein/tetratricopeptide (TPR) repeat protein